LLLLVLLLFGFVT